MHWVQSIPTDYQQRCMWVCLFVSLPLPLFLLPVIPRCPTPSPIARVYYCTYPKCLLNMLLLSATSVRIMQRAVDALAAWMSSNGLRTYFISIGTRQQLAKLEWSALSSEFPRMTVSMSVGDLGVLVDQELSMARHNRPSKPCGFYQLCQLRIYSRSHF